MERHLEPAREIPVVDECDVLVCGGGPAGVAAALASARAGASTGLIEMHGCLGGIWTAGMMCWILDRGNKQGIMAELLARLEERGARTIERDGTRTNGADIEAMKLLLDEMCAEAGVDVLLHTRVVGACPDETGRLALAITESKSGRQAHRAKVFVDCTGDGDLAALAGCGFDLGEPGTGRMQPMSLIALVSGIGAGGIHPCVRVPGAEGSEAKVRLLAEMERAGVSPSYSRPTLFRVRDDLFMLMANHEYGASGLSAEELTRATIHARREIHDLVSGLRSLGGPWQGLYVVATGEQIGVREGRRIHGRYTVTADDMQAGARHDDAVCRAAFGVDVHSPDPAQCKGIAPSPFKTKPYDIPLRALLARDVEGLLMAGRCISGDFIAHSSYRVTGNAVAMGEAAGKVAARAARTGMLPHKVDWRDAAREA